MVVNFGIRGAGRVLQRACNGKNKDKIKKKYQNIYKLTKPDIDNYIKFYMDCFNDKIWEDDSQVINISSSKRYSNSEPKTEVHIYQLN